MGLRQAARQDGGKPAPRENGAIIPSSEDRAWIAGPIGITDDAREMADHLLWRCWTVKGSPATAGA